jgi:SAM-dependent methyltransferase
MTSKEKLSSLFIEPVIEISDVLISSDDSSAENQSQTNFVFSEKWIKFSEEDKGTQERAFEFQKRWYLDLYNFSNEQELQNFLRHQDIVLDAGCGLGYKAKWFADLCPETLVIGMDYSDAVFVAAQNYAEIPNLVFVKGDIADTKIKDEMISYICCDQVIHHTKIHRKQ